MPPGISFGEYNFCSFMGEEARARQGTLLPTPGHFGQTPRMRCACYFGVGGNCCCHYLE